MEMKKRCDALIDITSLKPRTGCSIAEENKPGRRRREGTGSGSALSKKSFTRVVSRYGEGKNYSASALPIAVQAASASSSGASQQMTLSVKRLMFASSQDFSQERIHSPSPQP